MKHYVLAIILGVWVALFTAWFIDSGAIYSSTFIPLGPGDVLGYVLATWCLHRTGVTRRSLIAAALMIVVLGSLLGSVASSLDDPLHRQHLWQWLEFDTAFRVLIAVPVAILWLIGLGVFHVLRCGAGSARSAPA